MNNAKQKDSLLNRAHTFTAKEIYEMIADFEMNDETKYFNFRNENLRDDERDIFFAELLNKWKKQ